MTLKTALDSPLLVELTRHVRSAQGAAFFKKPIGTPLAAGEYESTKAAHETEQQAENARRNAARAALGAVRLQSSLEQDTGPSSSKSHADLLKDRTDMRAKYPAGHPDRLAAERAVRSSRKTDEYRSAGKGRTTSATSGTSVRPAPSRAHRAPPVPQSSPPKPSPAANLSDLTTAEKSRYWSMRNAGAQHEKAISNIHTSRASVAAARAKSPIGKQNPDGSTTKASIPGWLAEHQEAERKARQETERRSQSAKHGIPDWLAHNQEVERRARTGTSTAPKQATEAPPLVSASTSATKPGTPERAAAVKEAASNKASRHAALVAELERRKKLRQAAGGQR